MKKIYIFSVSSIHGLIHKNTLQGKTDIYLAGLVAEPKESKSQFLDIHVVKEVTG